MPSPKTISPVIGSRASSRKAASPMVAVSTAISAPKPTWPLTYWVTTTMAPPQPGSAPRKAATGTCERGWSARNFAMSKLNRRSAP